MTEHDNGPLAGVRVLDLTEHMAGPFCTMILADMGAEVVKLERPGKGDSVRAWGDGSERNPYFRYINRNKKGITLDYKKPDGKALFLRLVESIDVLVENYRPNVMPRAGLGWDSLRTLYPRLIYAQLSGLGYDGPAAGRGGFDLIAQGMGGIMHVTGEADGPADLRRPADLRPRHRHVGGAGHPRRPLRARAHRPGPACRMLAVGDRDRLQFVDRRRNGSPTTRSRRARARATARTPPISA